MILHFLQSSQDPPKCSISSTNQNTELFEVPEGPETWYGTSHGQVPDLVRVQVATESREKLHPLIAATLTVDENKHRLLADGQHLRLEEGGWREVGGRREMEEGGREWRGKEGGGKRLDGGKDGGRVHGRR